MKLKNIKLLKTLAVTGALGLVAAVPVITATACSSDTSNSGGSSGDNTGGGSSGGDSTSKVNLEVKENVNLIGALNGIYDGTEKDTNTLIAEAIEKDPSIAFKNADDIKGQTLNVTVDAGFPTTTEWSGKAYAGDSGWNKDKMDQTIVYASSLDQINISSLNNLKDQLTNDEIIKIIKATGVTPNEKTTYTVQNMPGLVNNDLIHVNVLGTTPATDAKAAATTTNIDLQIPTSDINLDISKCKISVDGSDKVNELKDATTDFNYNIGIDPTTHYTEPTTPPDLAKADITDATKALKALSLTGDKDALDNAKIASALGVFNCTFKATKIEQAKASALSLLSTKEGDTPTAGTKTAYTITLTATPNKDGNYYWTDGTQTDKEITFTANFNVK